MRWINHQMVTLVKGQEGLSLIEVLMALLLVFLTLLGFAGYAVMANTGIAASEKITRAVILAQEKMEDVRRAGLPSTMAGTLREIEPYGSIRGAFHHQRILTIQPHTPLSGLHQITVEVQWDHNNHTTFIQTYLSSH